MSCGTPSKHRLQGFPAPDADRAQEIWGLGEGNRHLTGTCNWTPIRGWPHIGRPQLVSHQRPQRPVQRVQRLLHLGAPYLAPPAAAAITPTAAERDATGRSPDGRRFRERWQVVCCRRPSRRFTGDGELPMLLAGASALVCCKS